MIRAQFLDQRSAQRDDVLGAALRRPRTEHDCSIIRQRPDKGDIFCIAGKRKQRRASGQRRIFQEHERAFRRSSRQRNALRLKHRARFQLFIRVRMFEQTQGKLDAQNVANGFVYSGFGHLAGVHQIRQMVVVKTADHIHFHAGQKRFTRGGRGVIRDAMGNQLGDGGPIAVNESLESPFLAQDLFDREVIRGGGHAVQSIERGHDRCSARVDRRVKGRKVKFPKGVLGNFHRVVLPAAFGRSIADKMFGAGNGAVRRIEVLALIAEHVGPRHGRDQIRILARTFRHPSPARVSRNIDHRRKHPADSACGRFAGGHSRSPLDEFRIPRSCKSERDREFGAIPVYNVQTINERDLQPRFFHRNVLKSVRFARCGDVKQRTDLALLDHVVVFGAPGAGARGLSGGVLHQLADLFVQSHFAQKRVNFLFSGRIDEIGMARCGAGSRGGRRILCRSGLATNHKTRHDCEPNQRGEHVIKNSDSAVRG